MVEAVALVVTTTIAAIGVVVGVHGAGFRISFVSAMFALCMGTAIAFVLDTMIRGSDGSVPAAGPVFDIALVPLGFLTLLPQGVSHRTRCKTEN